MLPSWRPELKGQINHGNIRLLVREPQVPSRRPVQVWHEPRPIALAAPVEVGIMEMRSSTGRGSRSLCIRVKQLFDHRCRQWIVVMKPCAQYRSTRSRTSATGSQAVRGAGCVRNHVLIGFVIFSWLTPIDKHWSLNRPCWGRDDHELSWHRLAGAGLQPSSRALKAPVHSRTMSTPSSPSMAALRGVRDHVS